MKRLLCQFRWHISIIPSLLVIIFWETVQWLLWKMEEKADSLEHQPHSLGMAPCKGVKR